MGRQGLKPGQRNGGTFKKGHDPRRNGQGPNDFVPGTTITWPQAFRQKLPKLMEWVDYYLDPQVQVKDEIRLRVMELTLARALGAPEVAIKIEAEVNTSDPRMMTTAQLLELAFLERERAADANALPGQFERLEAPESPPVDLSHGTKGLPKVDTVTGRSIGKYPWE